MFAAPNDYNESECVQPDQLLLLELPRREWGFKNEEHERLSDRDHREKRDGPSRPRCA